MVIASSEWKMQQRFEASLVDHWLLDGKQSHICPLRLPKINKQCFARSYYIYKLTQLYTLKLKNYARKPSSQVNSEHYKK